MNKGEISDCLTSHAFSYLTPLPPAASKYYILKGANITVTVAAHGELAAEALTRIGATACKLTGRRLGHLILAESDC